MKKEYVKPQNRVVVLKDKLLAIGVSEGDETEAKIHFEEDSDGSDSSSDVWED